MPAATPQLLAASKPIRGGVGAAAACAEKKTLPSKPACCGRDFSPQQMQK